MTKRSLAYLIETEMDKHSILFAAKDITNKLQQIAEQLAKMVANDIMPLGDAARDVFGAEEATAFEKALSDRVTALTDQVRDAKNAIADQIDALENGQPTSDLANAGDDMFGDSGDAEAEGQTDLDAAGDDMFDDSGDKGDVSDEAALDLDDIFSGDEEESNAAGRLAKESVEASAPVLEGVSADHQLTREFAGLIREGKTVSDALGLIAESYAIDPATVAEIVTTIKASKKKA